MGREADAQTEGKEGGSLLVPPSPSLHPQLGEGFRVLVRSSRLLASLPLC